jgi:mRNA interferase MazF
VKRGEIWTVAGAGEYAGKPRPAVIVQDDRFDAGDSATICLLTTDPTPGPLMRIGVDPNEANGLRLASWLMADKLMTVPKDKLGRRVGRLDDAAMLRFNRAMAVFLGLAGDAS